MIVDMIGSCQASELTRCGSVKHCWHRAIAAVPSWLQHNPLLCSTVSSASSSCWPPDASVAALSQRLALRMARVCSQHAAEQCRQCCVHSQPDMGHGGAAHLMGA
jgi:hypothetical protein